MTRHPGASPEPASAFRDEDIPFGPALAVLADAAAARLDRTLRGVDGVRIRPAAAAEARFHLLETMAGVAGLVLAAEFESFGGPFAEFEHRVVGAGPDRIVAACPGLSAHLRIIEDQWVAHVTRLAIDAAADLGPSGAKRADRDDRSTVPEITRLRPGLSDRHGGGRTVTEVRLSDGRRLAYKPRSTAPELLVARVLAWLAEGDPEVAVWAPRTLDRGTHGWMEWVGPRDVADDDELAAFFYRAGRLLFAIHLLSGVDCHAQNLIARGGHPVLVDGETVGHPATESHSGEDGEGVLGTGLLPYWKKIGERWVGLGGLGSPGVSEYPWRVASWQHLNRDGMALTWARAPFPELRNLPRLGGRTVGAYQYAEHVVEGFLAAGRVALACRDDLGGSQGPLEALGDVRVRFLARPTQLYADLISSAVEPQALRDPAGHWKTVESRLAAAPAPPSMRSADMMPELIRLEMLALRRLDVPRFEMRLDSTALGSAGDASGPAEPAAGSEPSPGRIEGFLAETGAERIRERIRALTPQVLADQAGLIRAALAMDRLAATANAATAPGVPIGRRYWPFGRSSRG
ncbi:MAG: DUF4135 domain-containing protein [Gemmatimonadetes bacterium]|nr:DUF4135 domain-containing protein [Gemmatimonadota bacterium]MBT8403013.1 DUF4135 domain-containing protein [Gemmatimonadota bacterium]NNF37975.1 type 2 lantipeptide synthetase LanM [Gemmatimonadota bacterium]NNK62395.1 type 2 lantipeptide synthetase LanM [Gemmatimonadota bacterium]